MFVFCFTLVIPYVFFCFVFLRYKWLITHRLSHNLNHCLKFCISCHPFLPPCSFREVLSISFLLYVCFYFCLYNFHYTGTVNPPCPSSQNPKMKPVSAVLDLLDYLSLVQYSQLLMVLSISILALLYFWFYNSLSVRYIPIDFALNLLSKKSPRSTWNTFCWPLMFVS